MKSIAMTGATGAIGMAILEQCIKQEITCYAFVRPDSARNERIPKSPFIIQIPCDLAFLEKLTDLSDEELEQRGLRPCDAFLHLGWEGTGKEARNDLIAQGKNVFYSFAAVAVAGRLGCKSFLFAGSQAEYGPVTEPLRADTPVSPRIAYGMAKLSAGAKTRELCRQIGIRHVWVRILSVYGPYDTPKAMIPSVGRQLLAGERPQTTAGEQLWDFMYCEDAARALLLAAEKGRDGAIYPIGSGNAVPLRTTIEMLKNIINPNAEIGFGEIPYGAGAIMHLEADISELTADTGFVPEVSLEDGLRRTVAWLRNQPE